MQIGYALALFTIFTHYALTTRNLQGQGRQPNGSAGRRIPDARPEV